MCMIIGHFVGRCTSATASINRSSLWINGSALAVDDVQLERDLGLMDVDSKTSLCTYIHTILYTSMCVTH